MTGLTVPQSQGAGYSSLQVCWEQRTSAAATGARSQTSNVSTLSGGAGVRFLLRAEGDAPAAPVQEPGRFFIAGL